MGKGFAYSIYFMLSVVFLIIPSLVGFMFWNSHRQNRDNSYQPAGGQRRWTGDGLLPESPEGGE